MRLAVLLLALLPGLAQAGAWPRPQGEVYVLLSHETGADWTGLYAEWGSANGLTFGLDLGGRVAALAALRPEGELRSRTFVRVPIRRASPVWRFAVELGLGRDTTSDTGDVLAPMRAVDRTSLGLAVGRGFTWRDRSGWVSLDLRGEWGSGAGDRAVLGATVGLKPTDRDAVELGLFAESTDGRDTTYAIGPTWERRIGRIGARLGLGLTDRGEARLRLGLTTTF